MEESEALLRAATYLKWWRDGAIATAAPPEDIGELIVVLELLADRPPRELRCPRCLHFWVSHCVPGEDDYGCDIPMSSMAEREQGIFEVCGCVFAEGNPVTPEWVRHKRYKPLPPI